MDMGQLLIPDLPNPYLCPECHYVTRYRVQGQGTPIMTLFMKDIGYLYMGWDNRSGAPPNPYPAPRTASGAINRVWDCLQYWWCHYPSIGYFPYHTIDPIWYLTLVTTMVHDIGSLWDMGMELIMYEVYTIWENRYTNRITSNTHMGHTLLLPQQS